MQLAEYLAKKLKKIGVTHVFGYPGSAVLNIIEKIGKTDGIEYVQNYHEQASAFAADAYARYTGKLGVALATSGPGATNLVTGIANAHLDSVPVLFITGQENTRFIDFSSRARSCGFQDLDIVQIVKPITKFATTITSAADFPAILEHALTVAVSGRPGAVLLDIPIDLQFQEIAVAEDELAGETGIASYRAQDEPLRSQDRSGDLQALHDAIARAARPVCLLGGGVRIAGACEPVRAFLASTRIPFVSTLNGLDAQDGGLGFAGVYGTPLANYAIHHADLLIAFGARFGMHHVGKNVSQYTNAKVIHVDIDAGELNRVFADSLAIRDDLSFFVAAYNQRYFDDPNPDFSGWLAELEQVRKARSGAMLEGFDSPVEPLRKILGLLNDSAVVSGDVGLNQMWLAKAYRQQGNRRLLNSTGLGAMGYAIPAALGVKVADPQRQVVAVLGDGGLYMNLQELLFIAHHGLGVKMVVLNNATLGMIRKVQDRFYDGSGIGTSDRHFTQTSLAALAAGFGISYCAYPSDDLTLQQALNDPFPCLIEIAVDGHEGASLRDAMNLQRVTGNPDESVS